MKREFMTYNIKKILNLYAQEIDMQKATLATQGISKKFMQGQEEIIVLNNIDSLFMQEKSYAITGISGSGKSTLIHIIAGLDTPTTGTVLFNNVSLQTFSPADREQFLNKSVGLVFQSPHLLRELSVVENIILPGLISGRKKNDCIKRALELLDKVELLQKKDSKIGELSGGQQQRVAIARAIFNEPAFLIADEPTGNLDIATGKTIIDLLLSCYQEWGMGIIVSSHDDYVAEKMDEIYTLSCGSLTKI
jgi:ABC-type lipoprotein export system ATPase subunit